MTLAVGGGPAAPRTRRDRPVTGEGRGRSQLPPPGEVHVWHASLDAPAATLHDLRSLLAADERARAERFRFDRDRNRYTAGRGLLRVLLGRYLGCAAESIAFVYGRHGKPYVRGRGLWFNLSHSGAEALFAFSSTAEVGVDVELYDEEFARERIAERFFSPGEIQALRALPLRLQGRGFMTCWTRKEAFIKARGDGLALALDSFDVTLVPWEPPALTRTAWSRDEWSRWGMADVSDRAGRFVAAVASRSKGWRVIERDVAEIFEHETVNDQEDR